MTPTKEIAVGAGVAVLQPLKLRERLTTVGLVLIILLMGLAFSNDFRRLFGG